jgi:outer membrane biogenesis lipoprotein LolB
MKSKIALIAIASSFLLVGCCTTKQCCTTPQVTKWEYKTLQTSVSDTTLDQYGAEGWSVVSAGARPSGAPFFLLKRAKP